MFDRLDLLIGKEKREILSRKTVMIIGVGGVGGYVCESLVRSGIGHLILVDYDTINLSNLNRQIIALNSNIDEVKINAFEKRIHEINQNCEVTKLKLFLNDENINIIDNYKIDYLIDCCDTISCKKALILKSLEKNIPLISSMGTGKRLDPSKLEITTLDKTNYDPIAKILRKFCRDNRINKKITVMCSKEQPMNIDSKTIASACFVPASAGLLIASYVFKELIID